MIKRGFGNSWLDPAWGFAARFQAQKAYERVLRDARRAAAVQDRILKIHLQANASSKFGIDHAFSRIRSYDDFRSAVPVRDYEQLRPYVQRVIEGDSRALFGPKERVLMMAMTSGSTDRPKHIPVTHRFVRDYRRGWSAFGGKALLDHPDAFLRPILQVTSPADVEHTASGMACGSISGLLAREQTGIVRKFYATPPQVARISDADARYYTIMRLAVPRDVSWIVTASPATPLKLARAAADHAERLIKDVRDGTLSAPGEIAPQLAAELRRLLRPDVATARRLEACLSKSGALLPRDYWQLSFMGNWTGGTLALHLRDFPKWFGGVPIREIGLLATEGRVSIGLTRDSTSGLLDCGAGFFEFRQWGQQGDDCVHRCHQLEIGGEYEVILTNAAGLYRYDLGDCVRVAGYVGQAPLLEYLHRGERVSSLTGEKLTEWQVTHAIQNAAGALGLLCGEFVLAPAWNDPPYYRLYSEGDGLSVKRLALKVDEELRQLNMEYAGKRDSQRLGPLEPCALAGGMLARWEQGRMRTRMAGEQYKQQYLLTSPDQDVELRESYEKNGQAWTLNQGHPAGKGSG